MGRSRARARREQARRQQAEQEYRTDPPEPVQPLAHRRLEERAVREGWIQYAPERERIITRLFDVIDRPDELGINDRYATSAAKALMSADLRQQTIEIQKQRAATAAIERARIETGTGPAESPDEPKRIVIPDVDDRLAPRED